jgi:hypothetical protein
MGSDRRAEAVEWWPATIGSAAYLGRQSGNHSAPHITDAWRKAVGSANIGPSRLPLQPSEPVMTELPAALFPHFVKKICLPANCLFGDHDVPIVITVHDYLRFFCLERGLHSPVPRAGRNQ